MSHPVVPQLSHPIEVLQTPGKDGHKKWQFTNENPMKCGDLFGDLFGDFNSHIWFEDVLHSVPRIYFFKAKQLREVIVVGFYPSVNEQFAMENGSYFPYL